MRVALLKSTFHSYGGLEKYCLRIFYALQKRGDDVTLLSSSSVRPCTQVCRRLKSTAMHMLWFDWQCRKWLRKNPQDIVFGFDRHFLPLDIYRAGNGCHAAYLKRRKPSFLKSLSFSINPLHVLTLMSEKKTFENPKCKLICNSNMVREEIAEYYSEEQIRHVVHNGVEWGELSERFSKRAKPSAVPQILFIGHEWNRKGLEIVLRAIALVPNVRLVAVGHERNPEIYIKLAESLGVLDRVQFVPEAQDPVPWYQQSQIFILPTLYDPFANVTIEAMAMGLYVITSPSNGASEIIVPGMNGSVVDLIPKKISESIVEACHKVQDPTLSKRIRDSVREYDFSNQLDQILSLIVPPPKQV